MPLMEPQAILAALVFAATLLAVVYTRLRRSHSGLPLPPGPPSDSIFGTSFQSEFFYRHFERWTQEYGPVFSFRQGLRTIVVVGRFQAAVDIMEKEGAALADRPRSIAAGETLSGGMRVLLTPAGERFKKMRRALHSHLQPKSVASYSPILMRTARQNMLDIIQDPERHQDHAKRYAAAVVMALAYGKVPPSYEDPEVQSVNRCLTRLGLTMRAGAWKVDILPLLKFVPGYLRPLKDGHAEELGLFKNLLQEVRDQIARGDEVPSSFGKYLIERQNEYQLNDDETAYLAGSMFGAGSDTTASAISVAVMAATCYPETQKKVQEELDAVIGRDRPPTFADQDILPQTMAFVLESFRWRPVTSGGFPHKATRDIIWNNYCIPKGASVIGNVWSVGRDPAVFPDPETFKPQRWIAEDGTLRDDIRSYPFGFGRRVCPGQHIATASTYINTALTLWAFNLREDEKEKVDTLAFTESANAHPMPFKVLFEPRLAGGWDAVREAFETYGM
ncbi:cytochrome P450 [Desarmillaria tabescens]|uniref:Cytochrome P450 n=1 Tax=Armillaria tabescens TaxID=1929756 RepID=A0AA39TL43_ARMTA|nr:cytochrome P450 [Desarmillaria tabescens]KAK0462942.1 cytochrome P450 [Desarmillaria tabescens]